LGGLASNVADQLAWARFHLGDGKSREGKQVLSSESIRLMQEETAVCPGSAIGDAIGIGWLLRDIDGTRVVGHGGDMAGQHSYFEMIPERRFAMTSLTNCGPNGSEFNERIMRWTFEAYAGVEVKDPEPVELNDEALAEYAGRYETIASIAEVTVANGGLLLADTTRPEVLAQLGEEDPHDPPNPLGLLGGSEDRYIVTGGPFRGMRGYFRRNSEGVIDGIHDGGRFATRTT
jgi:CubicO group peptidase (beta-lactamase class C family)